MGEPHDLRGQPVAVFEAVRHQGFDRRAEGAQRAQAHGARGGAIGIVVGDDEQFPALCDSVGQSRGHFPQVEHGVGRREVLEFVREVARGQNAAGGVDARKQRRNAGCDQ